MTPRPVTQLLADLRASVKAHRAEHGLPEPRPHFEEPWTREDHDAARAEARAADRKEGDPGRCRI